VLRGALLSQPRVYFEGRTQVEGADLDAERIERLVLRRRPPERRRGGDGGGDQVGGERRRARPVLQADAGGERRARRLQLFGRWRRRVGPRRGRRRRRRIGLRRGVGCRRRPLRARIGRRLRRLARLALGLAFGRVGGIEAACAGAHSRPIGVARDLGEARNVALLAAAFRRTEARRVSRIAVEHRPHQQRVGTARALGAGFPAGRAERRHQRAGAQPDRKRRMATTHLQSSSPGSRYPSARARNPVEINTLYG